MHKDGARGPKREYCAILAATAANERRVVVVEFVRNARPRFRHEFHLTDEIAAPGAIHLRAKLMLHGFDLLLPGHAVGGYFKASGTTADRARVSRKRRTHDTRPRAGKPRQRRFRPPHPAQRAAKKCSSSFHGSGILPREGPSTCDPKGSASVRHAKKISPGGLAIEHDINSVNAWRHATDGDVPSCCHVPPGRERNFARFRFADELVVGIK
jgi:hypothetical protein